MLTRIKRSLRLHSQKDECFGIIYPGTRVVRGPDWESKFQDNGEGFLGTIVSTTDWSNKDITVIWDSGRKFSYRGSKNLFDLRIFNTAESGVVHNNYSCSICAEKGIHGILWKCSECPKINLCSLCYMNDKHNLEHAFQRLVEPNGKSVKVPPREKTIDTKITAKGIFPGAEVIRGPDWCYDEAYCEDVGYVTITEPNDTSLLKVGAVPVLWKATEQKRIHRLGMDGCVDIVYSRMTESASGWSYYPDHLPVLNLEVCRFEQVRELKLAKIWKLNSNASNSNNIDKSDIFASSAVALYDFSAERDDQISFSKGDILFVLNTRHEPWWLATKHLHESNETNKGYVPSNYLSFNCNFPTITKAIHDYTARLSKDITVKKGESFLLLDSSDVDWWLVKGICISTKEKEGYVPRQNMEIDVSVALPRLVALQDYHSKNKYHLSFEKGDTLFYLDEVDDHCWYVCSAHSGDNTQIQVGYALNDKVEFSDEKLNEGLNTNEYEYLDCSEHYVENCVDSFIVEVVPNKDSIRLALFGTYRLTIDLFSIELTDLRKDNNKLKWYYEHIRGYNCSIKNKTFILNVGRRCESGEGEFIFRCENADGIDRTISKALHSETGQHN